ncbi:Crp/Fnr family transcriptional regulator [Candidatus Villigracilis affinis]|jgi:CRP-like cAMP-binding protein|uniref:Crp/Fnr family transcriptional regulator n=1 Tax=Candidatus Villigracilis affinis TaxID=3140682 RepID=UPI001B5319FA|nr:Crp/Fnr family transcriptional regulator [Anaerolineales bacterium]MBP8047217.1 Crp/Fnr family transcriptional regulator [Anaerolineales bacterium]
MCASSRSTSLADKLAFLKQVPLCAHMADQELIAFSQDLRLREYAKGQIVFEQGDLGHTLSIILTGKIRVFRLTPSGLETTLTILGTGDLVGEFAVIDQQPRSASARSVGKSSLLQMNADTFFRHIRELPNLALGLMRVLVAKTRWTAAYAETIARYDAAGRLLHILLLFNEKFGEEKPDQTYILDLGLNQTDLASLVGVRREWVNRILQYWSKKKLVEFEGGKLVILDLARAKQERDSRLEANLDQTNW